MASLLNLPDDILESILTKSFATYFSLDLLIRISKSSSLKDLASLRLVCKKLYSLSTQEAFWIKLLSSHLRTLDVSVLRSLFEMNFSKQASLHQQADESFEPITIDLINMFLDDITRSECFADCSSWKELVSHFQSMNLTYSLFTSSFRSSMDGNISV